MNTVRPPFSVRLGKMFITLGGGRRLDAHEHYHLVGNRSVGETVYSWGSSHGDGIIMTIIIDNSSNGKLII